MATTFWCTNRGSAVCGRRDNGVDFLSDRRGILLAIGLDITKLLVNPVECMIYHAFVMPGTQQSKSYLKMLWLEKVLIFLESLINTISACVPLPVSVLYMSVSIEHNSFG